MPNKKTSPDLKVLPMLPHESIYIGVDIGKQKHIAGFVSKTLLERHKHFENCPAFSFEASREGFRSFVERIRDYCPLEHIFVLMELTGHYHRSLQQYLLELDIPVYVMHVQRRQASMIKTDKRDALSLANQLYTQLELGAQVTDKLQAVRRTVPPSATASQLKGLMRHRYELVNEATQRKNKLTAICDELFPELTQVLKDPNLATALALRERFPTPHALATASFTALSEVRVGRRASDADLLHLQHLATQSIGTKDVARQRSLVLEQSLLIKELRLIQEHLERLEGEVCQIVTQSREGQILTSIPPIGPLDAATLIAVIGSIANFEKACDLKSYLGWAPKREQTGTSYDRTRLSQGGSREAKRAMYLIVWRAIRTDTEWSKLYKRLVPRLCSYDERTQSYRGKGRAIGHVAGRLITLAYALLRYDYEVVNHLAPGTDPPAPMLYDLEVHHQHRSGHYHPLKRRPRENRIVQVES
ncbi:IS110 family transposase [Ktedonobacter robiniae]|uniref:IS110 family transposase n=1 Tax=Ktedonobacter robiniae TaxID=2778365 RepID=A0ABQ3UTZ6_9CHLR|nr:IS110 family transposase [Ktedonobacter robiniae]GHO56169.1 IS110 family transposase [Ktedonobacter robiniae]GHO60713.1 IS110 family transposase [Ktedonobacter robiniae]